VKSLQALLSAEEAKCSELERARNTLYESRQDLEERLKNAQDEVSALQVSSQEAKQKLSSSEVRLAEEQRRAERLEEELTKTSTGHASEESLRLELESKVSVLEQASQEQQAERLDLKSLYDSLLETHGLVEKQLAESRSSRQELREELDRAEQELEAADAMKKRLEELEQLRQQPGGELAAERTKTAQLQSNCMSLKEQLRSTQEEVEALKEELAKAEADLRQKAAVETLPSPVSLGKATSATEIQLGEASTDEEQALLSEGCDDAGELRQLARLKARIGDLEAQNANLKRSLNQRPIVYQFTPPDAGIEEDPDQPDEEEGTIEEDDEATGAKRVCLMVVGGCRAVGRRTKQGVVLCRKQKLIWSLEQQLRWLTRELLKRPMLMWLFYAQLLWLWGMEIWRQALSKPLATDPSTSLEVAVQAATSAHRGN